MPAPAPRPELLAFLAAIKAEPEEDTPKLALADWFQEQPDEADQARGEFLRQFVRNNQLAKNDPARQDLYALSCLWDRYGQVWAGRLLAAGFKVWATNHMFRWSMLFPVLDGSALRAAEAVADTEEYAWVAGITLSAADPTVGTDFARSPLLDTLVGLRVPYAEGELGLVDRLCTSHRVAAIQVLDLGSARAAEANAIANSPNWPALRQLVLRQCPIHDAGFRSLCASRHLDALRSLDVSAAGLTIHAARAFADGLGLPALTELRLGVNQIGPDGTLILVAGANTGRLRKLDLSANGVADYGVEAICRQSHLCNLTHLDLSQNLLTDRAAVALAGAEHLKTLEELNLRANAVGDAGARTLAKSPHLTNLRRLNLTDNSIGARAAGTLRERFGPAFDLA